MRPKPEVIGQHKRGLLYLAGVLTVVGLLSQFVLPVPDRVGDALGWLTVIAVLVAGSVFFIWADETPPRRALPRWLDIATYASLSVLAVIEFAVLVWWPASFPVVLGVGIVGALAWTLGGIAFERWHWSR